MMKLKLLFSLMPLLAALSALAAGPVSTTVTIKNKVPAVEAEWSMAVTIDQYASMKYNLETEKFSPNLYTYEIVSTFESVIPTYGLDITLSDESFSCVTGPNDADIVDFLVGTDYEIVFDGQSLVTDDVVTLTGLGLTGLSGTINGTISVSALKDLAGYDQLGASCSGHASFLVEATI